MANGKAFNGSRNPTKLGGNAIAFAFLWVTSLLFGRTTHTAEASKRDDSYEPTRPKNVVQLPKIHKELSRVHRTAWRERAAARMRTWANLRAADVMLLGLCLEEDLISRSADVLSYVEQHLSPGNPLRVRAEAVAERMEVRRLQPGDRGLLGLALAERTGLQRTKHGVGRHLRRCAAPPGDCSPVSASGGESGRTTSS